MRGNETFLFKRLNQNHRLFCSSGLVNVFPFPLIVEISPPCLVMNAAVGEPDSLPAAKTTTVGQASGGGCFVQSELEMPPESGVKTAFRSAARSERRRGFIGRLPLNN